MAAKKLNPVVFPVPSANVRSRPPAGTANPAGSVSARRMSNAPLYPAPVLFTTTANRASSPASTPLRLLLTGALASRRRRSPCR